ncbi:MAG: hypothetical protein ACP5UO_04915 [Thermoplasmata archaeon]
MKGILVRREKAASLRKRLIEKGVEFYEEREGFHILFLFPSGSLPDESGGKNVYLVDSSLKEIDVKGKSFAIRGGKEAIDRFAPLLEKQGMKVDLEHPDVTLEIRRWGSKFLVNVF